MADKQISVLLRAITGPYNAAMAQSGAVTQGFGRTADAAATKVDGMAGQLKGTAGKMMAGGGFLFAVGQGSDRLMSYQDALVGVGKTTDLTGDRLTAMGEDLTDLAINIRGSSEEMMGIAQSAAQLGIANQDIESFTETVANLASATDLTTEAAATDMARLANITQLPADKFENLASSIVRMGNTMATTEPEVLAMAQRVASAGEAAGMTEAEIIGLSAAASSMGLEAEAGGSALSMTLIEIQEAAIVGGDKLQAFAETAGTSADQFATLWREEPVDALMMFLEGLNGVQESGGNTVEILDALGLDGLRVSDTLRRLSSNTGLVEDATRGATDAFEKGTDAIEEANTANATASARLDELKDSWEQLQRTVLGGGEGTGALAWGFERAAEGVRRMNDAADAFQWTDLVTGMGMGASAAREWSAQLMEKAGFEGQRDPFAIFRDSQIEQTFMATEAGMALREELQRYEEAAREHRNASGEVEEGVADLEVQLHETRQAQRDLADEMLAATDPAYAFIDAQDEAREASQRYAEALEDPEASAHDVEAALLDMVRAQQRVDAAALASGPAFAELTASIDELEDQGRLTAAQADEMREKILGARDAAQELAGNYQVNLDIQIRGMEAATDRLTALAQQRGYRFEGRAKGGDVSAGVPYMTGEEGPELFVPDRPGRIIPARETAAMMASGSTSTVIHHNEQVHVTQQGGNPYQDAHAWLRKRAILSGHG